MALGNLKKKFVDIPLVMICYDQSDNNEDKIM